MPIWDPTFSLLFFAWWRLYNNSKEIIFISYVTAEATFSSKVTLSCILWRNSFTSWHEWQINPVSWKVKTNSARLSRNIIQLILSCQWRLYHHSSREGEREREPHRSTVLQRYGASKLLPAIDIMRPTAAWSTRRLQRTLYKLRSCQVEDTGCFAQRETRFRDYCSIYS